MERGGAATVPTAAAANTIAATAALASGQVVLSSGFPGVQAGRERLTGLAWYPTVLGSQAAATTTDPVRGVSLDPSAR